MRKPRDYDAELKALDERARLLKERRVVQLGELVIACRADTLPLEQLAGVLLEAVATKDASVREGWRLRGAAFFQQRSRQGSAGPVDGNDSAAEGDSGTPPPATVPSA